MSYKINVPAKNNSGYFFLISALNDMIEVYGDKDKKLKQAKEKLLKALEGKENNAFKPNENDLWNVYCEQTIELMNNIISDPSNSSKEDALRAKIKLRYPLEEAFRIYTNYITEVVNADLESIFEDDRESANIEAALRDNETNKILKTKEELKQRYVPFFNIAKQVKAKNLTNNDLLIAAENSKAAIAQITNATHSVFENKINREKLIELKSLYEKVIKKGSDDFFSQPAAGKLTNVANLSFQAVTRILMWEKELKIDENDEETFRKLKEATKYSLQVQNVSKSISELTRITNAMLFDKNEIKIEINSETKIISAAQIEITKEAIEDVISKLKLTNDCELIVENNEITLKFNDVKAREKFLLGNNGLNSYNNEVNSFFYDTILNYLRKANDRELAGNKKSAEKYRKIASELINEHNQFVNLIKTNIHRSSATSKEKEKVLSNAIKSFTHNCSVIIRRDSLTKSFQLTGKFKDFAKEMNDSLKESYKKRVSNRYSKISQNVASEKSLNYKGFRDSITSKTPPPYDANSKKSKVILSKNLEMHYKEFTRQTEMFLKTNDLAKLDKATTVFINNCLETINQYNSKIGFNAAKIGGSKKQFNNIAEAVKKSVLISIYKENCKISDEGKTVTFDFTKQKTFYKANLNSILFNAKEIDPTAHTSAKDNKITITFSNKEAANEYLKSLGLKSATMSSDDADKRKTMRFFEKAKPVQPVDSDDETNEPGMDLQ